MPNDLLHLTIMELYDLPAVSSLFVFPWQECSKDVLIPPLFIASKAFSDKGERCRGNISRMLHTEMQGATKIILHYPNNNLVLFMSVFYTSELCWVAIIKIVEDWRLTIHHKKILQKQIRITNYTCGNK